MLGEHDEKGCFLLATETGSSLRSLRVMEAIAAGDKSSVDPAKKVSEVVDATLADRLFPSPCSEFVDSPTFVDVCVVK